MTSSHRAVTQITTSGDDFDRLPTVNGDPLFVVRKGSPSKPPLIKVEFRGSQYYVEDESKARRSLQCLALVTQLLALHKESDELPRTTFVNVSTTD